MRIVFIVTMLLLCPKAGIAQTGCLSLGYSISYYNMNKMDALIDRYNQTRSWLTETMPQVHFFHGPQIGLGVFDDENLEIGISWTNNRATTQASGTPQGGTPTTRYLRVSNNRTSLYFQLYAQNRVGLGGGLDLDMLRTRSKLNSDSDYELFDRSLNIGATLMLSYRTGKHLMFRTYYFLPFIKSFFPEIGEELDGVNYMDMELSEYKSRPSHIGASVSILLLGKD